MLSGCKKTTLAGPEPTTNLAWCFLWWEISCVSLQKWPRQNHSQRVNNIKNTQNWTCWGRDPDISLSILLSTCRMIGAIGWVFMLPWNSHVQVLISVWLYLETGPVRRRKSHMLTYMEMWSKMPHETEIITIVLGDAHKGILCCGHKGKCHL